MKPRKCRPVMERFMEKVALAAGECWEWMAQRDRAGYGRFRYNDQPSAAHRVSYMLHIGPIPEGLQLDHLCRNRACVNPWHLEPVTPLVNTRRSEPAQRTHCPRGHAYDEANTRRRNGKRHCLACHRINQRNYLARKAVAA